MLNFFKTKSIFKSPDDDVRFCCSGAAICLKCWPLMTAAVLVTDRRLRGMTHVYVSRHYCWKVFCRMVVRGLWLQTFVVGVFWTTRCALLGVRRTWMRSVVAWNHADFLFDVGTCASAHDEWPRRSGQLFVGECHMRCIRRVCWRCLCAVGWRAIEGRGRRAGGALAETIASDGGVSRLRGGDDVAVLMCLL